MKRIVILSLLVLAACATRTMEGRELSTTGNRALFDDAVIAKVVEGKSTKADVRATFGEPNNVSFASDGAESWNYVAGISRMQTMTVSVGGYTGDQAGESYQLATDYKWRLASNPAQRVSHRLATGVSGA
jgi:outer membrane protein assembly factor BamE (lipoprotein component of BamABCDE complex)